jgi:hypothetical protein
MLVEEANAKAEGGGGFKNPYIGVDPPSLVGRIPRCRIGDMEVHDSVYTSNSKYDHAIVKTMSF